MSPSRPPTSEAPAVGALLDLSGRAALVTGAGSGIGQGIARRFGEAGAAVAVHYRSSAAGAERVVSEIEAAGGRAVALPGDLTQAGDAAALVEGAVEALGRLDVLVNNCGAYPEASLLDMTPAEWDEVVDANLRTVFLCTQAAARRMAGDGGGAIVNVTSIEAENPAPAHTHYGAAKAGATMHTRSAAAELGPRGIRVNAVAPGVIWHEGIEETWPDGVERYRNAAPLGRIGLPEDVADACLFLASDAARWITGASLTVDGGALTGQVY